MTHIKQIILLTIVLLFPFTGQSQSKEYPVEFRKSEVPPVPEFMKRSATIEQHREKLEDYLEATLKLPKDSVQLTNKPEDYSIYSLTFNHGNRKIGYRLWGEKIHEVNFDYTISSHDKDYDLSSMTSLMYYENGKIKVEKSSAGFSDREGFYAGVWKLYDPKGKIIKKLDFDSHFKLKLIDVVGMVSELFYFAEPTTIQFERGFDDKNAYWVCYLGACSYGNFERTEKSIIINDRTKEIIYENGKVAKYLFKDYQNKLVEDFWNRYDQITDK